jgi:hypothetical protein
MTSLRRPFCLPYWASLTPAPRPPHNHHHNSARGTVLAPGGLGPAPLHHRARLRRLPRLQRGAARGARQARASARRRAGFAARAGTPREQHIGPSVRGAGAEKLCRAPLRARLCAPPRCPVSARLSARLSYARVTLLRSRVTEGRHHARWWARPPACRLNRHVGRHRAGRSVRRVISGGPELVCEQGVYIETGHRLSRGRSKLRLPCGFERVLLCGVSRVRGRQLSTCTLQHA